MTFGNGSPESPCHITEGSFVGDEFRESMDRQCATIFIGIVNEHYLDEDWEKHKQRFMALFRITDTSFIMEIKISSIEFGSHILNSTKLAEDTTTVMQIINCLETNQLRFLHMGAGHGYAVDDSIESLIRGWDKPEKEKHIQYINHGESKNFHSLNFCKRLCMKQLCGTLQFYNTDDFTNFGYYDLSRVGSVKTSMVGQN